MHFEEWHAALLKKVNDPASPWKELLLCNFSSIYPPSVASLSSLKSVSISDLTAGHRHDGCVVYLRVNGITSHTASMQSHVQDAGGNNGLLAIYCLHPQLEACDALPEGRIFAVKEPYYEHAENQTMIRVDHPSDLLCFLPTSSLVPAGFRAEQSMESARSFKDIGNTHIKAKRYHKAFDSYTHGIATCSQDDHLLRADLLRNRSYVNMLLGRFEMALADANQSILPIHNHQGTDTLNAKSLFRASRAQYALGKFEKAQNNLIDAIRLAPNDQSYLTELKRIKARIAEASQGQYDFDAMYDHCNRGNEYLDHADFTHNVAIQYAATGGRGLFAKKGFKAGDLIMCEKAFMSSSADDYINVIFATLIAKEQLASDESAHPSLIFRTIDKLRYNPELARKFLDLWDGGRYKPKHAAVEKDGLTVIDTFEVERIIHFNSYGSRRLPKKPGRDSGDASRIWLTFSRINHACNGNAESTTIGDMMFVFAFRDISRGEEITTAYHAWDSNYMLANSRRVSQWRFTCTCSMCLAEQDTFLWVLIQRQALVDRMGKLTKLGSTSARFQANNSIIKQIEEVYGLLAKTYDQPQYKDRPRLALIEPEMALMAAYGLKNNRQEAEKYGLKSLQSHGFKININGGSITIDCKHAMSTSYAVDAAMHLCALYANEKQLMQGLQFMDLGKEMWKMMHGGTIRGLEEEYMNLLSRYCCNSSMCSCGDAMHHR